MSDKKIPVMTNIIEHEVDIEALLDLCDFCQVHVPRTETQYHRMCGVVRETVPAMAMMRLRPKDAQPGGHSFAVMMKKGALKSALDSGAAVLGRGLLQKIALGMMVRASLVRIGHLGREDLGTFSSQFDGRPHLVMRYEWVKKPGVGLILALSPRIVEGDDHPARLVMDGVTFRNRGEADKNREKPTFVIRGDVIGPLRNRTGTSLQPDEEYIHGGFSGRRQRLEAFSFKSGKVSEAESYAESRSFAFERFLEIFNAAWDGVGSLRLKRVQMTKINVQSSQKDAYQKDTKPTIVRAKSALSSGFMPSRLTIFDATTKSGLAGEETVLAVLESQHLLEKYGISIESAEDLSSADIPVVDHPDLHVEMIDEKIVTDSVGAPVRDEGDLYLHKRAWSQAVIARTEKEIKEDAGFLEAILNELVTKCEVRNGRLFQGRFGDVPDFSVCISGTKASREGAPDFSEKVFAADHSEGRLTFRALDAYDGFDEFGTVSLGRPRVRIGGALLEIRTVDGLVGLPDLDAVRKELERLGYTNARTVPGEVFLSALPARLREGFVPDDEGYSVSWIRMWRKEMTSSGVISALEKKAITSALDKAGVPLTPFLRTTELVAPFTGLMRSEDGLYISGSMGGPKDAVTNFPVGKKVVVIRGEEIPDEFWGLMLYRGVRFGRADTTPFLFKHLNEYVMEAGKIPPIA